jgi:hypothetical protein
MKYLIFETDLLGHRLEYLHYYYVEAMNHLFNNYVFYIPEPFKVLRSKYEWVTSANAPPIQINLINNAMYFCTIQDKRNKR